jgi:preprotein translocase subunit SecG
LFVGTDADIVFNDGIFICCFSMILGIVLMLLAETKQNEWKKSVRLAKAEALRLTNAPVAEATKFRVTYVMGGVIIVVGLVFDIFPIVLVGVVLMIPSGLATMSHNTQVNQAFHRLQTGHQDTLNREK